MNQKVLITLNNGAKRIVYLDVLPVLKHRDSSTYRVEVLHVMVEAFFPR